MAENSLSSGSQASVPDATLQTVIPNERQRVPGDNSAYYAGPVPRSEQLFEIDEFDIAPNPPLPDHRFFGFLGGIMPDLPNLNESLLRFSLVKEGHVLSDFEKKFADCKMIFMRHNRIEFIHELRPGRMEFLTDSMMLGEYAAPGIYTFRAEAVLPDGRVLFCLEFSASSRPVGSEGIM
ncbi:hypothetical protein EV356DRAFT_577133 [Viridothelium virens]|uniref:Uncharacterized protein n=1 Tax=Viridothelium virens TaxID=1048519 RepID=A0A6A6H7R0_VIRVR|nr:hypothetical protein EV356DRAFT_577133 [Viridothelium virens]